MRHSGLRSASSAACGGMGSPDARSSGGYSPGVSSPTPAALPAASSNSDTSDGGPSTTSPATKKSTTRRNAWGNMSYADLITQAIMSSPEKRLTLSQGEFSRKLLSVQQRRFPPHTTVKYRSERTRRSLIQILLNNPAPFVSPYFIVIAFLSINNYACDKCRTSQRTI